MSSFWKVFITAFVSTVIVGGITFYFMNQKLIADNKDKDAKIADLTKQVTDLKDIDTTSWKTYTNSKYGYSFKYPNDFIVEQDDDSVSISDTNWFCSVVVQANTNNKTLEQLAQGEATTTSKTTDIKLGALAAKKITFENVSEMGKGKMVLALDDNNEINVTGRSLTILDEARFDRILSTFQFTK